MLRFFPSNSARATAGCHIALWAICAQLVCACQPTAPAANEGKVLMENDFEQSVGWGTAVEGPLTNAKAHSGKWATAVNGEVNFGFTFERTAGRLAPQLPHRLRLRAWALRANPGSTAKLVVQVNASATDTAKVFYGTLPLATEVREFDKWTAVSYPFTLPTSAAASNVIKIYLWRDQATAPTYLDDIALISEE